MIKPIVAVGVVILALMLAVKDHRVLRAVGLVGGCTPVETMADGSQLQACGRGKLEGFPDLTKQGCTYVHSALKEQLWSCPAAVVASSAR
jgi:hypothetical protein